MNIGKLLGAWFFCRVCSSAEELDDQPLLPANHDCYMRDAITSSSATPPDSPAIFSPEQTLPLSAEKQTHNNMSTEQLLVAACEKLEQYVDRSDTSSEVESEAKSETKLESASSNVLYDVPLDTPISQLEDAIVDDQFYNNRHSSSPLIEIIPDDESSQGALNPREEQSGNTPSSFELVNMSTSPVATPPMQQVFAYNFAMVRHNFIGVANYLRPKNCGS